MTSLITQANIPDVLVCPITKELMKDPVITNGGQTYERKAIEEWMRRQKTDPLTRDTITCLIPNFAVKNMCQEYRDTGKQNVSTTKPNVSTTNMSPAITVNAQYVTPEDVDVSTTNVSPPIVNAQYVTPEDVDKWWSIPIEVRVNVPDPRGEAPSHRYKYYCYSKQAWVL